ncbi:MAG: hypothetical protein MZV49_24150 [Rhodopseudomonas palustris]|nr:hypothetical protein [Rhodopseudomonas palustris]
MEMVAGFFVFLVLVAWMLATLNGQQLSMNQVMVWRPVTFVGEVHPVGDQEVEAGVFMFVQALIMFVGLGAPGLADRVGALASVSCLSG